jgi:phenylalanyl-tRNA synthetase alpha chain
MRRHLVITDPKEREIMAELEKMTDFKSLRMKRLLALPDLTKKANSPVKILFDQIINLSRFKDFDIVDFPRVISVEEAFDVLNSPKDHPSRRETDTYYLSPTDVLRTQTTSMWAYYLRDQKILEKLKKDGHVEALSAGIVFRKDEIDRSHYPAFHQIDGLLICKKDEKIITVDDLKDVEIDIAKSIFGNDIEYKFLVDSFPFTDPSIEMDIKMRNDWMEVVGSGLVHKQVLINLGLDPGVYNGWAFGFGVDRLAMIKMGIPDIRVLWSDDPRIASQFTGIDSKYKEVSKYPSTIRDISFIVDKSVALNNYFEIVREYAGNLIEEVKLLDTYDNAEKFGKDKVSYTFRITYCSPERTLTNEEVNAIQDKIREKTASELHAILR